MLFPKTSANLKLNYPKQLYLDRKFGLPIQYYTS